MEFASFTQQLKALVQRNILIKKRNKAELLQELLFPICHVVIFVVIKIVTKPIVEPTLTFPSHNVDFYPVLQPCNEIYYVSSGTPTNITPWMEDISNYLNTIYKFRPTYVEFDSDEEAEKAYRAKYSDSNIVCGITFSVSGHRYDYTIRLNYDDLPHTNEVVAFADCEDTTGPNYGKYCKVNNYLSSGFIQLQLAIEDVLLKNAGVPKMGSGSRARGISLKMMATEKNHSGTSYIQTFSSIWFVIAFSVLANYCTVHIVTEKEKKIKEVMLIIGLRRSVLWMSWTIVYMVLIIVISTALIAILFVSSYFEQSSFLLLFICFIMYGASIVAFAFTLTSVLHKAKVAGAVAGFSTVAISVLHLAVSETKKPGSYDSSIPPLAQGFLCLLSPFAFACIMNQGIFLDVEMDGFGFDSSLSYGEFPLYVPIFMLPVDIVLYCCLTMYLDHVIPREDGGHRLPYFFLLPSYWRSAKERRHNKLFIAMNQVRMFQSGDFEPVSQQIEEHVAIRISNLTKEYTVKKKPTQVVDSFSLNIYKNQITCLLGHSGAGKTTLMNMLIGIIPPTSGAVFVMGHDITKKKELDKVRRLFGVCPQYNILYDQLTCREHLQLFAQIKGVPKSEMTNEVEKVLADVYLENQIDIFSKYLSGGQKRKLSVAIALVGNPKIVILDEPTAGMDPFSRQQIWSLLKEKKEGRVTLLTTHFMDEADILADRIAFIRKGKLQSCGSSPFLKSKFGIGYHLTLVVEPFCDLRNIEHILRSNIPEIKKEMHRGRKLSFSVPLNQVSKFGELFDVLDEESHGLGISNYKVTMTTLEEVFLKLEDIESVDEYCQIEGYNCNNPLKENKLDDNLATTLELNQRALFESSVVGKALTSQRFWALLKVRFFIMFNNKVAMFWQMAKPVSLIILSVVNAKHIPYHALDEYPPLVLKHSIYHDGLLPNFPNSSNVLMFYDKESIDQNIYSKYISSVVNLESYQSGKVTVIDIKPHFLGLQIDKVAHHNGNTYLTDFTVLYNNTALHSIPILISMASQSILHVAANSMPIILQPSSHPWPQLKHEYDFQTLVSVLTLGSVFTILLPGVASDVVKDRELKLRGQLRVSGIGFDLYWVTIYLSVITTYVIPCGLMLILIVFEFLHLFDNAGAIGSTILIFLTNIPFNILMSLVMSFLFDKSETCNTYLFPLLVMVSAAAYMSVISLDQLTPKSGSGITLHYIMCVINPLYIIYGGFYFVQRVQLMVLTSEDQVNNSDYFHFDNHIIICIIMPVVHTLWMYWLLRVLDVRTIGGTVMEASSCLSQWRDPVATSNTDLPDDEDDDVVAERRRIEILDAGEEQSLKPVVYTSQLRKTFVKQSKCNKRNTNAIVAVRNLSIAVEPGEILGILGPNGCGKSTLLNMIATETAPTCGKIIINGENIRSNVLCLHESLAYCPQYDALWENITLEQHINCFARIKGVAPHNVNKVTDFYISKLKLEDHRKKEPRKLSIGTKRKLSYIINTLGSPSFVLLDLPSIGMDPKSKAIMWDLIRSNFANTDRGAILTTHYTEEADLLCDRVGIMVNGQLQCLGSTQHLKDTFGCGYVLEVKLKYGQRDAVHISMHMDSVERHLRTLFPQLETIDRFMDRAQYSIAIQDAMPLGKTFMNLEKCKTSHDLEWYSFSQCTLEQVFLYFAKHQVEHTEDEMTDIITATETLSQKYPYIPRRTEFTTSSKTTDSRYRITEYRRYMGTPVDGSLYTGSSVDQTRNEGSKLGVSRNAGTSKGFSRTPSVHLDKCDSKHDELLNSKSKEN